jgi:hypothetical protein
MGARKGGPFRFDLLSARFARRQMLNMRRSAP